MARDVFLRRARNPVVWLVLYWRYQGVKHSEVVSWRRVRELYDYTEGMTEVEMGEAQGMFLDAKLGAETIH